MAELLGYRRALAELMELAGHPEAASVRAEMRQDLTRAQRPPADSTVADWIAGRAVPRHNGDLDLLLSAVERIVAANPHATAPCLPSRRHWHDLAGQARESPPAPPEWRKDVVASLAWKLIPPDDQERTEDLRHEAAEAADRLAGLYASVRQFLADDPWHDEHLPGRVARRVNHLVHLLQNGRESRLTLSPAEAALIALLPLVHHVHRSRTSAGLSRVDPTDLGRQTSAGPERQMYEVLLHAHERLLRRAELGVLKDRRSGQREIGWWLFEQWTARQPGRLRDLLSDTGAGRTGLGGLLDPELLSRLLASVHARPKELFDTARPEHLRADPFQLDLDGRDFQTVRERLVGPLFAVAHGMAIEVTHLPSVIVRHVGIPDPLDPARLLTTVDTASWQPRGDGLGLKAGCDHPAVVAALTEHTGRLESLLRAVRRGADTALDGLPGYTHADEVREQDDQGRAVPVDGVIRFRLDEERVQELLMGENLYRDRSLAIRELYQNALDACRYRRARAQYRDGFSAYQGRIEFVQGYDEDEGRHYLECRDNGVGMDELTLSEVFAQAGVRFTDLPRFQEERREWRARGITVHPNSRFGIGVLSYFMLADEVRVTTCHMDGADGRPRELTVLISGPGHYFRVRPTGRPGTTGTTVRLYLRDGDKAPSCVSELRKRLGIAEFTTTATHGTQTAEWKPGVLMRRKRQQLQTHGLEADGELVPASGGGEVVWCELGGGVLVDGIFTEPRVRDGVLADPQGTRRLRGVIVNLVGSDRPKRLSVDRTEILDDDICATVERLVKAALPALTDSGERLLTTRWLSEVANESPLLADLVTEAAAAAGTELELDGRRTPVSATGFFPPDLRIVGRSDNTYRVPRSRLPVTDVSGEPDGTTLLWRLLAHRPNADLAALTLLVPELDRVASVLPARPSDVFLRTESHGFSSGGLSWSSYSGTAQKSTPGHALTVAQLTGVPYSGVLARMRQLGMTAPPPPEGRPSIDAVNFALLGNTLSETGSSYNRWRDVKEAVPPGHLVSAHFELDISVSEAAERMRSFGFTVPDLGPQADTPDDRTLGLLRDERSFGQWLGIGSLVPPGHLVRASLELGMSVREAARRLRTYGLLVHEPDDTASTPDEHTLRLLSTGLTGTWWLDTRDPVPIGHVFHAAATFDRPVLDVVDELTSYGFLFDLAPGFVWPTLDRLKKGTDYGWSAASWAALYADGTVPGDLLAYLSAASGTPLHEIAEWTGALGLRPPESLPQEAEAADAEILGTRSYEASGHRIGAGRAVSTNFVAEAALQTGLPPRAVVARLRAYGVQAPPGPFPEAVEPTDPTILVSALREPLPPGRPVSVHHVIQASRQLGTSPRQVLDRLAEYGFTAPVLPMPDSVGRFDLELLFTRPTIIDDADHLRMATFTRDMLPWDEPVPVHHIVRAATYLRIDPHEVAERLAAYGFRLPDTEPHQLDSADLGLCNGGSRSGEPDSILLRGPIRDFLYLAHSTTMPPEELVARLKRLGADVHRVADEVRATLPKVPGLVMAPEAGE
ncbi:wHTH domain-containing protein [Streptomyces fuscichromogenes]|uniref:ATP-binding protein n=1 Tax=Streptomyces fuscichromogenes TaxID=1324013 RepID=A0A918CRF5_9ACTN|nr:hypothetical protein [Streptomyces fuscichromogenes]GGN06717.1 hypothetical protein GCM10011578_031040 [Streptomyces fuscichromogenes]